MAYSVLVTTAAGGTVNGVTSSAIDTTGADLLVVVATWYNTTSPTISDSKTNTWTALTLHGGGNATLQSRIYYSQAPTVGTGHTFSIDGSIIYPVVSVVAASGSVASPFDVENGNNGADTGSMATGSITPSQDNELIVAGVITAETAHTVDSGMTGLTNINFSSGFHFGGRGAYKIQTTAAAINETFGWTGTGSTAVACSIASFKASGGAAATWGTLIGLCNNRLVVEL